MALAAAATFIGYSMPVELANIIGGVSTMPSASDLMGLGMNPSLAGALGGLATDAVPTAVALIGLGCQPEWATLLTSDLEHG